MAYAAYRDPPGAVSTRSTTIFQVLDVTVTAVDAFRVRRTLAAADWTEVLSCEPLQHPGATYGSAAPRVRLHVRLASSSYDNVVHRVLECVPDGEIGHLTSWRSHLQRRGVGYAG